MRSVAFRRVFMAILLAPIFCFSYFLRALGLRNLNRAGACLGAFLHLVRFRRSIVSANLKLALGSELSGGELDALIAKIYRNIGCTFLEIGRNFSLTRSQMRRELVVEEADRKRIEATLQRGKGIVFLSAHIANWELLAMGVAEHGIPASIVVKKQGSAIAQSLIERQRMRTGLEIVYSGGTIENMRLALRRGRVVGFMIDQNVTGAKGIRCNFFGVPAASIRALGKLVRETGAAVIPICAFRQPDGTHLVKLLPDLPYLTADGLEGEERQLREEWLNAQQYQTAAETLIRMHPEQWLWIHRRWKTRRDPLNFATAHLENAVTFKG